MLVTNNIFPHQRRYMIKFSTDGAVLSNHRGAVQGTVKLIDVNARGKPIPDSQLAPHLQKEVTVYYYVGMYILIEAHIFNV